MDDSGRKDRARTAFDYARTHYDARKVAADLDRLQNEVIAERC